MLQYVLHEEGRLKIITPVIDLRRQLNAGTAGINWPGGKQGVFEYFIKDHLSNTRVVLTEEVQKEFYHATMEQSAAKGEEPLFGKVNADGSIPADNELKATRYVNGGGTATPWPNNTTDFVRLSAAQNKTMGPGMILRVMAGDLINAQAKYFYYQNNPTGGSNNPVADVLQSLVGAIGGAGISGVAKVNSTQIQNALNLPGAFSTFIQTEQPGSGNTDAPKAYLNIIFLDEQFTFIERDPATPDVGTHHTRVSSANDANASFAPMQQKAPVNGYVFVYLSNQSNESVYFDEFYVTQEHSAISEESHYYPHGLKIAAISSRAFNKLENKYGYQGDYSEQESETGWNEFALRNYDPQIGRWTGVDPYDEFASPYVGMGNDPINNIDPDGGSIGYNGINWFNIASGGSLTVGETILSRAFNTAAGALVGGLINSAADGWNWKNFGIGAA